MTLKYMQGFDTMRDDSDFRAQGWVAPPTKKPVGFLPSFTAVAGVSLQAIGAFTDSTSVPGAAGVADFGYFNTGITVNQAWTAGGFTFGFAGRFNSGVAASYASSYAGNGYSAGLQMCFDGTRYWALRNVGGSINVYYSTDLSNWTVSPAQPTTMNTASTLQYVAGNVVCVTGTASNTVTYYYSANSGASWTSGTASTTGTTSPTYGVAFATGNATYPLGISCMGYWSSNPSGAAGGMSLNIGTFGSLTSVYSGSSTGAAAYTGTTKVYNGIIFHVQTGTIGCKIQQATQANASLNTAGAWTQSTLGINAADMIYHPTSNLYVFAHASGISTTPNTNGSAGNAAVLPASPTLTSRYSTVAINNIFLVGTTIVAVGQQGHIVTSTDGGITWVESGGHILPAGTSGTDWRGAFYDGTQYVLFSDSTSGVIAVSPDLQTNFVCKYVQDNAETATRAQDCVGVWGGTAPAANGTWTAATGTFLLAPAALSAGSRTITVWNTISANSGTFNVAASAGNLVHYYELKATKVAGTVNSFNLSVYVDGVLAFTDATPRGLGNSTSDTTSLLILNFHRSGQFVAYDDLYFTLDDGINLVGPLGAINIVAQRPSLDAQSQWTKAGSASSNSLSVNQAALSSLSTNSVSSNNAGDKDIYTTNDTLPAGYTPKAIQNEAYFARTSTSPPAVQVGTISGSTETDSPPATINNATPTYVSQIVEKDPNGNVNWTAASVNAAKFAITHQT